MTEPQLSAPEPSPRYAAAFTAMAYGFAEFLEPPADVAALALAQPASARLEFILTQTFSEPEMRAIARELLMRLKAISEIPWQQGVVRFLAQCMRGTAAAASPAEVQERVAAMPDEEAATLYLSVLGVNKDLDTFVTEVRADIALFLQGIAGGDEGLHRVLAEMFHGLFTTDAEKSRGVLTLTLRALGEPQAVIEIRGAITDVARKLASSAELAGAVEMMAGKYGWQPVPRGGGFAQAWQALERKVMASARGRDLRLPGSRMLDETRRDTWGDETSIAQVGVFKEMERRIKTDPLGLIQDAYQGKLKNSLAVAAENDILDEIRHLRACRRDRSKETSFDVLVDAAAQGVAGKATRRLCEALGRDAAEEAIGELTTRELLGVLTGDEKTVIDMDILQGYKIRDIAAHLGKSEAYVYKVKRRALGKMKSSLR